MAADYWRRLTGRAPERSSPYSIQRAYDFQGNIRGATTYDGLGKRAFQYEFGSGVRHGAGYHTYQNVGRFMGFGKRPPNRAYPILRNMTHKFVQIHDQESLDEFLVQVDRLHDALLKECSLVAHGYVDSDLRMFGDTDPYDARLVFQMQSAATPCVEIILEDVTEISLWPGLPLSPQGVIGPDGIRLDLAEISDGIFAGVRASRAKYALLDRSCLGRSLRTVEPIPVGTRILVDVADDGWVVCPTCNSGFQMVGRPTAVVCDVCGAQLVAK